ncbi:MAG: antitoxin component YwqK of YwqJK toxin-antitoxin module, partial [Parvicella sp.]
MNLKSLIIIVGIVVLSSCAEESEGNKVPITDDKQKELYENGNVRSEGVYNADKKKEGLWISYYESGNVQDST